MAAAMLHSKQCWHLKDPNRRHRGYLYSRKLSSHQTTADSWTTQSHLATRAWDYPVSNVIPRSETHIGGCGKRCGGGMECWRLWVLDMRIYFTAGTPSWFVGLTNHHYLIPRPVNL